MSKYNKTLKTARTATVNLASGNAYTESAKLELASIAMTSFVKDQFYRSANDTLKRLIKLTSADPFFAAKAAIYTRHEMGMRSVSHVIAGQIARQVKGEEWTKRFFEKVVRRVDDVTEILAYFWFANPKAPIPNSMKKGLGAALSRFDAYQIAKYRQANADISLVDAVNLLHPPHTEALSALIRGTLAAPETWEVQLTQAGSNDAAKADVWRKLIGEGKIGYFALLRNLRNIVAQAPDMIDKTCELLTNRKMIKQSLVLPFRFQTAIDALQNDSSWQNRLLFGAINAAVDISLENMPHFEGATLIALDDSSSMTCGYPSMTRGNPTPPAKIGSLFAVTMHKALKNSDLLCFSNRARYMQLNPADSTLTCVSNLQRRFVGGGTNFHAVFEKAQRKYDRIIILSDMQGWIPSLSGRSVPNSYRNYCIRFNCSPKVYSFDLAGYGTLQFPESNVFCLAGFGDKTLDLLAKLDHDKNALITEIESVVI